MLAVRDGAVTPGRPPVEDLEEDVVWLSHQRELHGSLTVEAGVGEQLSGDQGHVFAYGGIASLGTALPHPGPSGACTTRFSG